MPSTADRQARVFNHTAVSALLVAALSEPPLADPLADTLKPPRSDKEAEASETSKLPATLPTLSPTAAEQRGDVVRWESLIEKVKGEDASEALEGALRLLDSPWRPDVQVLAHCSA